MLHTEKIISGTKSTREKFKHTFIRNIIGDILPKVQATSKHPHLLDSLFHIP